MSKSSSAAADRPAGRLYQWADERLGLTELMEFARRKQVPLHSQTFWYYWGGISLFFFTVQVFTGVLLLVYFRPGPDAYDSVRQITYEIDFGWLIRSTHSWAANLMVFAVVVHMFSAFFMKAYRKPREFGWWSGLVLLALVLAFGFSGYLLPMDELAYFATKVGLEIPASLPGGALFADLLRGGAEVGEVTVQRFFALHAVVLPLIFLPVLMFHLVLVQRHGNALPPSEEAQPPEQRRGMPFFPHFFAKELGMWLFALNVLAILATLFPWDLGPAADALRPAPVGIHPEWYFMSPFQLLKGIGQVLPGLAGEIAGLLLFSGALILWTLVPLFDPQSATARRARQVNLFGLLLLAALIATTIWGYADL
jgi:quinol-cytochrome oxidoreductase complex cytochrome b subunit